MIKAVAPFTGAWIEITAPTGYPYGHLVAPFTGAWIEIRRRQKLASRHPRRALHGRVD